MGTSSASVEIIVVTKMQQNIDILFIFSLHPMDNKQELKPMKKGQANLVIHLQTINPNLYE